MFTKMAIKHQTLHRESYLEVYVPGMTCTGAKRSLSLTHTHIATIWFNILFSSSCQELWLAVCTLL